MKALVNWFKELVSDAKYSAARIKNLDDFQDINFGQSLKNEHVEGRLDPRDFSPVFNGLVEPVGSSHCVNLIGVAKSNAPIIY